LFTGIVTSVGTVKTITEQGEMMRLAVSMEAAGAPPEPGASIALGGICLTVTGIDTHEGSRLVSFDIGPETLAATTAGSWSAGTRVNIERALKLGDELGGHLVSGHVDGVAQITERRDEGETVAFAFTAPEALSRFIAVKGSVALDGTSLTVNAVEGAVFSCHLIPHTLAVTTWGERRVGDSINLEVDQLARYVERMVAPD